MGSRSFITTAFERGEYNNRSQTASSSIQERCNNAVSENTMTAQNTPVQSKNHTQTWTRCIDSRLALKTKPKGKQRQRNTRHAIECWCHTNNYKHPRLHDTAITTGNLIRQLPTTTQTLYHQRLGKNKGQIPQDMRIYWTFVEVMALINVILKGTCVVIPKSLKTGIRKIPC